MDTTLFLRPLSLRRMTANKLGIILFQYAKWMYHQGYSRNTIHQYTQAVEHFGYWRSRAHPDSRDPSCVEVGEFLSDHLTKCTCPIPAVKTHNTCRAALFRLLEFLEQPLGRDSQRSGSESILKLVSDFDTYLDEVSGLSPATRIYRRRYAHEFLDWRFGSRQIDPSCLSIKDIFDYAQCRAAGLKPDSLAVMIVSLRSFTRFLEFRQLCKPGLSLAWPTVARWKRAPAFPVLSLTQCDELMTTGIAASTTPKRDRAILLLVLHLGLRTAEVASFQLDCINWIEGTILVRHTKQRRERLLPLSKLVGEAISDYILHERPDSQSSALFLCHRIPAGRAITLGRVRGIIRRALQRIGLPQGGPHLLRHSLATRLHSHGASLKEVSDVLGHQNLDTTAIYARVNLPQLRQVALPWPRPNLS